MGVTVGGIPFEQAQFANRLEWVSWVITTALVTEEREHPGRGLTTTELTKALLRSEGALTGSLRDNNRAARSERHPLRQEVRAALAMMLLDGFVRNPPTGHTNVWHLTSKARG